jgi:hypothetical protein
VNQNMAEKDELFKEIQAGKKLDKVSQDEMKKREDEKKARLEKAKKAAEELKKKGQWKED